MTGSRLDIMRFLCILNKLKNKKARRISYKQKRGNRLGLCLIRNGQGRSAIRAIRETETIRSNKG